MTGKRDSIKETNKYTGKQIVVLEGLAPVRKRPAMYIGSTDSYGLHHCLYEIVDNAIDEALAGFAKNVWVILHQNNSVTVADDGRGIPIDIHPKYKKSALELGKRIIEENDIQVSDIELKNRFEQNPPPALLNPDEKPADCSRAG